MPKLIDYPRTSYAGAWEVADVVDDTGGKCALDTCARKLNRKVSGSFKAIVGSAVKFGLLTSKRELLTTTTLFRRIKHAYDKQEELLFHREAFLTPPLFTQLCRKFRSRELPVQMLDIMLIREFDVEEINAQSVAKAFVDGARMVGVLDERNIIADIDQLAAQQPPRRELASPELNANTFRAEISRTAAPVSPDGVASPKVISTPPEPSRPNPTTAADPAPLRGRDAVASLFNLSDDLGDEQLNKTPAPTAISGDTTPSAARKPASITSSGAATAGRDTVAAPNAPKEENSEKKEPTVVTPFSTDPVRRIRPAQSGASTLEPDPTLPTTLLPSAVVKQPSGPTAIQTLGLASPVAAASSFRIELSGPGINTILDVQDEDDLALARILLDKIGRQLKK